MIATQPSPHTLCCAAARRRARRPSVGVGASAPSARPRSRKATDVGVTATEIHIAIVADVDNPFAPGVFKPSVDGIKGVAKYINETGGLAGRKLVVDFYDSKLNANATRQAQIDACANDLAMVGTSAFFLTTVDDIPRVQGRERRRDRSARHPVPQHRDRAAVLRPGVPGDRAVRGVLHRERASADVPDQRGRGLLVPAAVRQEPPRRVRVHQRHQVGLRRRASRPAVRCATSASRATGTSSARSAPRRASSPRSSRR